MIHQSVSMYVYFINKDVLLKGMFTKTFYRLNLIWIIITVGTYNPITANPMRHRLSDPAAVILSPTSVPPNPGHTSLAACSVQPKSVTTFHWTGSPPDFGKKASGLGNLTTFHQPTLALDFCGVRLSRLEVTSNVRRHGGPAEYQQNQQGKPDQQKQQGKPGRCRLLWLQEGGDDRRSRVQTGLLPVQVFYRKMSLLCLVTGYLSRKENGGCRQHSSDRLVNSWVERGGHPVNLWHAFNQEEGVRRWRWRWRWRWGRGPHIATPWKIGQLQGREWISDIPPS